MHTNSAEIVLNTASNQKDPASFTDKSDDPDEAQPGSSQEADKMNFDDALDDDNENPVSQTLVNAAENSEPSGKNDTDELDGEADEDGDKR